jgi:Sap, sulfolipid-1-addressing protein
MLGEAIRLIPYALLAALSPLGFAATITVMKTGRLTALGFALGVLLGQLVACTLLVLVGGASIPSRNKNHPTFQGLLELAAGIALLWLAAVVRHRPPRAMHPPGSSGRSKEVLERLARVRPFTASVAGLMLGIGGPKRLVLTALASASITAAGVGDSDQGALILWYSALATVVVWLPILAYVLLGEWATTWLDRGLEWLTRHQRPATVWVLVVVAVVLFVDAAATLL